jgi:hypothetical protein
MHRDIGLIESHPISAITRNSASEAPATRKRPQRFSAQFWRKPHNSLRFLMQRGDELASTTEDELRRSLGIAPENK